YVQRPVRAVIGGIDTRIKRLPVEPDALSRHPVGQRLEAFQLAEIRQEVVKAPTRIAEIAPAVEVLPLASHEYLAVDVRGTTRSLAARQRDGSALQAGFGLGLEPGHEFWSTEKG